MYGSIEFRGKMIQSREERYRKEI